MGISDNLTDRAPAQAAGSTIGALLEQGRSAHAGRGDSTFLEAQLLLEHVLGRPRSELLAHPERVLPAAAAARFQSLLGRAAAGEPLAYLTGAREFWSLPLAVTPAVLIPRPETELAVERCLALLPDPRSVAPSVAPDDQGRILVCDLGTGSGAIALALASERPSWRITATDRSAAALAVAQVNAARLGLSLEWLQGDWFAPLHGRRFDLVVSNPPYIGAADPALTALAYEPREALVAGPSGFEALCALVAHASAHLAAGGALVLEHGADQAAALAQALVARGYARVRCHQDLAGRDRVTEACWP